MHNPYPDLPLQRARDIATDILVIALLAVCWLAGHLVHDAVAELDSLGRGVERAGTQVRDGFESAGDKVDGTPIVGDDISKALDDAGRETGQPVVRAGAQGRDAVAKLANILGWTVGGVPALLVLYAGVPGRVRRMRSIIAARRMFAAGNDPDRQRLLAMRAAFNLPFGELLAHTQDPIGDLARGHHDPLLRALSNAYGVRVTSPAP